jgi:pimeloyl-ACP methyl ester carboxylesterase
MSCTSLPFYEKMTYCLFFFSGLLFVMTGCSIKQIRDQSQQVENSGFIKGTIALASDQEGALVVLRFRNEEGVPYLESRIIASEKGDYLFTVIPGTYYIAAYIDANNDGHYQPDEHGRYYGSPSTIDVAPKQTVTLDTMVISGPAPQPDTEIKPIDKGRAVWNNIGQVTSLDDARFTSKHYDMGLWRPFDFLDVAEGGLFFLQEYQPRKEPIIFVHGISGGPTVWRTVIESLDREHFQPWVLFYPSGLRLDMISDYLVQAVSRLQNRYGFARLSVVAHSMGGLVTRSFVKKYVEHAPENLTKLKWVMTINSPMAGIPSAAIGVKNSPIVIPCWRDVEPSSAFLQGIHSWNWPREIPYHLVVSYTEKDSGDGVVSLESQVPLKLQSESTRIYLFNNDHVGTLSDNSFLDMFNGILNGSSSDVSNFSAL